MQQFPTHQLVQDARDCNLDLIPSDFNRPLCASVDGPECSNSLEACLDAIAEEAQSITTKLQKDIPLSEVIELFKKSHTPSSHPSQDISTLAFKSNDLALIDKAILNFFVDSGMPLSKLSAKYALEEPGIIA